MSVLSDRLAQRTAQYSAIPVSQAKQSLSLPSTYYNGATLRAAGTVSQSYSDKLKTITERRSANNASVANTIAGRVQQKSVQDALAAAQQREAAAQKAISDAQSNFSIDTPTAANVAIGTVARIGQNTDPSKTKYKIPGKKATPAKQYADDRRNTAPAKGYYGTSSGGGIQVGGSAKNTSGSAGALGGSHGSGAYKYAYNTSLGSGRNKVLSMAVGYLGTRYVLGGESHTGIDCSGLVQAIYQQMGFKVPTHSAADQGGTGGRGMARAIPGVRTSVSNLRPGDLVAWKDGSHIAIYAGNGKIIEAANPSRGTVYRNLWASAGAVVGIRVTLPGDGNVGSTKAQVKAKSNSLSSKAKQYR